MPGKRTSHKSSFIYVQIATAIELQILQDTLSIGDKLPSLRTIANEYGVSLSSALQAYYYLERKSLVEARPKSGYFVSYSPKRFAAIPLASKPGNTISPADTGELVQRVYRDLADSSYTALSLSVPANEWLPVAKLNKGITRAMRELKGGGTAYAPIEGNEKLRKQVARWSLTMSAHISATDLLITSGCINAVSYCLMAVTKPGNTIIVESPVSFGILPLARSMGLNVLELPTHPQTGIDLDALKTAVLKRKISAILLISNFSNPLGSCMPEEHKKEVVKLIEKHNIPLIENDLYGDLYFGAKRPGSCKTYDESGLVLWCSSVSKTLAPGYRVGWVAPGKYMEKIVRIKLYQSIASTAITQEVIADFLETERYENHLRKLRQVLHANSLQYARAIHEYFPEGTLASRPQGGLVQWVELPKKLSTMELYEKAVKQKISIAPGKLFTLQKQFDNCMRLNYGLVWNEALDHSLQKLGRLAKAMMLH